MIFCYADPPYIGTAERIYGDHPDYQGEVNHRELIAMLHKDYPDGWALSLSAPTLYEILGYCHEVGADVRVGAWVKPWSVWKDKNVAYAWEPLIWEGGRKRDWKVRSTALDWCIDNAVMYRKNDPNHTKGTKPDKFCFWLFDVLCMEPDDEFVDMFYGSGAVTKAWERWKAMPHFWRSNTACSGRLDSSAQQSNLFTDGNLPSKARGATRRR